MTYETYRYIFLGALIACGIFLALAVVLFFTMKIPKAISDLSGRTARKAIENIRLQNEQSGNKIYQSSAVNLERGKLTDKISNSGRLVQRDATPFGTGVITEKISTQKLEPTPETEVLTQTGTTDVLYTPAEETSVLAPEEQQVNTFKIEFEITYIHSDEVIA